MVSSSRQFAFVLLYNDITESNYASETNIYDVASDMMYVAEHMSSAYCTDCTVHLKKLLSYDFITVICYSV